MGYSTAPVGPAIVTLRAVCRYISDLVRAATDAPARKVKLLDAPGAEIRVVTVEEVIQEETAHARDHWVRDIKVRA